MMGGKGRKEQEEREVSKGIGQENGKKANEKWHGGKDDREEV